MDWFRCVKRWNADPWLDPLNYFLHGRSDAVRPPPTGELAAQLPWLWPDAHSLYALTQPLSHASWLTVRRDPAALILLLGHQPGHRDTASSACNIRQFLLEPLALVQAIEWYRHDQGVWLNWQHPACFPIYHTALSIAHHAHIIAALTRRCDPDLAWTAGLLAPLGWFVLAATEPDPLGACITVPEFVHEPRDVERLLWGLDHSEIARRVARAWGLPEWLRVIVAHLRVPIPLGVQLGSDRALLAITQLATTLVDESGAPLGLSVGIDREAALRELEMSREDVLAIKDRFARVELAEAIEPAWVDPREHSHFPILLQTTLDRRRAEAAPFIGPLERQVDRLQDWVVTQHAQAEERLKTAKLEALAEFSAGASHEINNPLAVISGQSQYLLNRESDERRQKALQSIIRQTQRIHSILTELMSFARPPRLQRQRLLLAEVVESASAQYRAMAEEYQVRLEKTDSSWKSLACEGDSRLLQTAIGCLIRNAIEAAAPTHGWVRLSVATTARTIEVIVEDSGPGLSMAQREHMFDPFYCGRPAGRGRGLGLPTAWRLAREHGGDVRYVPLPDGPTRFVLSLPLAVPAEQGTERMSA